MIGRTEHDVWEVERRAFLDNAVVREQTPVLARHHLLDPSDGVSRSLQFTWAVPSCKVCERRTLEHEKYLESQSAEYLLFCVRVWYSTYVPYAAIATPTAPVSARFRPLLNDIVAMALL